MAVIITDQGGTIQIDINAVGAGASVQSYNFNKQDVDVAWIKDEFFIEDDVKELKFLYTDVTVPVSISAEDLRNQVRAMINTGSGDATAANQVLEIALLTDIETNTEAAAENTDKTSTTGTTSSVASSAVDVTLLASNVLRKGATIFNESTQVLYVKLGSVSSLTSYTTQIPPNGYYEVPYWYVGEIDGIWAAANGNARITELT